MAKIKCYGWNPSQLSSYLTMEELVALRKQVEDDPKSKNPAHAKGSIWIYSKAARRKLDAISWAITYQLAERKKETSDGQQLPRSAEEQAPADH